MTDDAPERPPAPVINLSDSSETLSNSSYTKAADTKNVTFNKDIDVRLRSTSSFENDISPLNKHAPGDSGIDYRNPSSSSALQNRVSRNPVDFSVSNSSMKNSNDMSSRVKPPLPPKPKGQQGEGQTGSTSYGNGMYRNREGKKQSTQEEDSSIEDGNQQSKVKNSSSAPLYDSSLSPEERMRLYRQQLQFS